MKKLYNQFACSSFMLPEHVDSLEQREKKIKEVELQQVPELDEQQLELWERILQESLQDGRRINVRYMMANGPVTITGVITGVNAHQKRILLYAVVVSILSALIRLYVSSRNNN